MRKTAALTVAASMTLCSLAPAYAVNIDRTKVIEDLRPGQTVSGVITVSNSALEEKRVRLYMEDFEYVEPYNGDKRILPPHTLDTSVAQMIKFNPFELTMPPSSNQRITYSITAPDDFDSMRAGILFFESNMGEGLDESGQAVKINARMGVLIFCNPAGVPPMAAMEQVTATDSGLRGIVANTGKRFFTAKGTYYILNENSIPVDRGSLNELYVFPGDRASFELAISDSLAAGEYFAVITYDLGQSEVAVSEVDFKVKQDGSIEILDTRN